MNEGPERSEIEFSKHVPGSEMPRRVRGMDCAPEPEGRELCAQNKENA